MIRTKPNDGAFACPDGDYASYQVGLTKREYIAGHVLAGVVSNTPFMKALNELCAGTETKERDLAAIAALEYTDALIAALGKESEAEG